MKQLYSQEAIKEIEKLRAQNKLMRQLATKIGFFQYYFNQLKYYKTNIDCFNAVNDTYYDFFGEYKYSSYNSFQIMQTRFNKK